MAPLTEDLDVTLGERSYRISLAEDTETALRALAARWTADRRSVAILTDRNVDHAASSLLNGIFAVYPKCIVEAGEGAKSIRVLGDVLEFLAQYRIDRTGVLIALGGGVVGDLGGYAAASFLRGIDYIQVPTTLLAMVDSSVGGKTGINLSAGKNLAGAFHQPRAVVIGTRTLATLPAREFAAGMAEIIKYGLLGDAGLFELLEKSPLTTHADTRLPSVIRRCCAQKAAVVQSDERELAPSGGRALLNLGHTFGHAIEQATGYKRYLHGEAVAIGLIAATHLSAEMRLVPAALVERVTATIAAHGLPTRIDPVLPIQTLMEAMLRDKKVRNGRLRFIVLESVGRAITHDNVDPQIAEAVLLALGASRS